MPDLSASCITLIAIALALTGIIYEVVDLQSQLRSGQKSYEQVITKHVRLAASCLIAGIVLWLGGFIFPESVVASIIPGFAEVFLIAYGGGRISVYAYYRWIYPRIHKPPQALPDFKDIGKKQPPYL